MTVSFHADRIPREGEPSGAAEPAAVSPIADPAPLGLAAFALTTFLLSAANAGWMTKASGDAWLGYAFAYGGLAQLLAGMWEFRNKNVFGSTAFGSYGAFWIGLGLWEVLLGRTPPSGVLPALLGGKTVKGLGWIPLAWAIFNTYMLLISAQTTSAVFAVFLTLEITEVILFIGFFTGSSGTSKLGGYIGLVTALVAWYTSAAGGAKGLGGPLTLPVGRALIR